MIDVIINGTHIATGTDIECTVRHPRDGEGHGRDYIVTSAEFREGSGALLKRLFSTREPVVVLMIVAGGSELSDQRAYVVGVSIGRDMHLMWDGGSLLVTSEAKRATPTPAAGPWIALSERLPPASTHVIVWTTDGFGFRAHGLYTHDGARMPKGATHWSEILPPKETP
jgi:hypothetical protein